VALPGTARAIDRVRERGVMNKLILVLSFVFIGGASAAFSCDAPPCRAVLVKRLQREKKPSRANACTEPPCGITFKN
jgi:hypothetical protein